MEIKYIDWFTRINQLLADYFDVHFYKNMNYIWCLYAKTSNSIKSTNKTNQNYRKYISLEKNDQALFKSPNLRPGQLLKPGQKCVWGQLWGQASPMGPGQASFYSMPYGQYSSHVTAVMTDRLDNQLWIKGWVILSEPFTFNWMIYVEQFACKITGNDVDMDFWTFYKSMTQTVHRKERGKLK